jgi:hypothetical protein
VKSADRIVETVGDLIDRAGPVDLGEETATFVLLGERSRLRQVDLLASTDHRFGVVGAAFQSGPLEETPDELLVGGQQDHAVQGPAEVGEQGVRFLDVLERAWVAVEEEAAGHSRAGRAGGGPSSR